MSKFGIMLSILLSLMLVNSTNASTDDFWRAPKSKRTALMLSLGSTLIPIALGTALAKSESEQASEFGGSLIFVGAIVGPGVGQGYANRPVRLASGALIRTFCLGLAATGVIFGALEDEDENKSNFFFFAGLGGYTFSAVYDIVTVGSSVDAYNHKRGMKGFSIGHLYYPREKTHGLAFTLRF